ncbi:MAG: HAD hydrolase family protein, partial [Deltaproteobacteria bacterium]|jgi:hypothetical protein|nr:HAD hydrolase family protein [Deltaproteobacteria bacterium]
MEIDYLISSSGLGTSSFGPSGHQELLSSASFSDSDARLAIEAATELGLGFFLGFAPPEAHNFFYEFPKAGGAPSCFATRVNHAGTNARPWKGERDFPMAQVLLMAPPDLMPGVRKRFGELAPGLSQVLCTSPYGDGCQWLEVYPEGVSKGRAAERLARSLGLGAGDAVALGNDHNDTDLLAWAGDAFVSSDAPESLKALHENMPRAGEGSLDYVLKRYLGKV